MNSDVNGLEDTVELIFADYDCNNINVIDAMDRVEALIKAEQNKLLDMVLEQKQFIACLDTDEDHNVVPIEAIKTLREGL